MVGVEYRRMGGMSITWRAVQPWLIGAGFVYTGISHFRHAGGFIRIVPPQLPAGLMVAVSGVAEIAGGVGMLVPPLRTIAGYGLILLLIAVFPANIYMLLQAIRSHEAGWWQALLWVRLPLQPLLIWWIWRVIQVVSRES
jgi:uncharacterized membrane protein